MAAAYPTSLESAYAVERTAMTGMFLAENAGARSDPDDTGSTITTGLDMLILSPEVIVLLTIIARPTHNPATRSRHKQGDERRIHWQLPNHPAPCPKHCLNRWQNCLMPQETYSARDERQSAYIAEASQSPSPLRPTADRDRDSAWKSNGKQAAEKWRR